MRGEMRLAADADWSLLIDWSLAFAADCGLPGTREEIERSVDFVLRRQSRYLWTDAGEPVSMAGTAGATPHGIRIGSVYTPPHHRGRGCATALVATLTQSMFAAGRRFCFLYTDAANPTSNAIYERIGYRYVGASAHHQFG